LAKQEKVLLIFTRYPIPGAVKTRLHSELSEAAASRLHRRLTESVVSITKKSGFTAVVCYCNASRKSFRSWLGRDLAYYPQSEGDIGVRMRNAVKHFLDQGAKRVAVIGCDLPFLTVKILQNAFNALNGNDIVLGPTSDGGYYLIGMKKYYPQLFSGIDWGTNRVADQTREIISSSGLSLKALFVLDDIDDPEDLVAIRNDSRFADIFKDTPQLSVIIPVLNEESVIRKTIESLKKNKDIEIIVSDGGSRDKTKEICEDCGVKFLEIKGGRYQQLNAAVSMAESDADTVLPEGFEKEMISALDDPTVSGGAFRFKTDDERWIMRIVEWGVNLRSQLFKLPYGDQGIFVEKGVFNEIGGFFPMPIMEDFELIRAFRTRGNVKILPLYAVTSARRWRRLGIVSTVLINQIMIAGYFLGFPVDKLAAFYRRIAFKKQ